MDNSACGLLRPAIGKMFLVVVDAPSKWIEAHLMQTITSSMTVENFRSTHWVPAVLVSDNGPSLVSAEFKLFLHKKSIKHVTTAPCYPSSNGCAERVVQTVKGGN